MDRRKRWTAIRALFVAGALCYSVLTGHAMTNGTADESIDQSQGTFLSNDICRVDPMVPNVVGQSQADAQTAITSATLVFAISTAHSESVQAGLVISQMPPGGGVALSGSTVALVISSGPATGGGPLSPWLALDIGAVGVAGSTTGNASSLSMSGSGSDIWNAADAFRFAYQALAGDGQIVARVASLQNTDSWAKAGVMIRDGLTPDARYAALVVTPGNGLAFQRRLETGGSSTYTPGTDGVPTWMKLVRAGTTITAYHSADGVSWTPVGSETVALSSTVYIGLAVTSHNNGVAAAAAFDNVATVGTAPPPSAPTPTLWLAQDIGAVGVAGTTTGSGTAFSVSGSGSDIWNAADAFQFVYQPLDGDGQIVARVASLENTDSWAKAGVMIRNGLTPDARYAALVVTPGNGLAFQRRLETGGPSIYTPGADAAPAWVKLVRAGTTITAYHSADGVSWTLVGSDTVALSSTVYIGLAVTSHNNGVAAAATFDTVMMN